MCWFNAEMVVYLLLGFYAKGQLKVIELFSYSQSLPFIHYSFTDEGTVADEVLPHSSVLGLSLTTRSWIRN